MMMKILSRNLLWFVALAALFFLVFVVVRSSDINHWAVVYPAALSTHPIDTQEAATERYTARVDRVEVVFEHWDYTKFRLQTNDLIREGELQRERGFDTDPDATVYVLYAQKPIGEQIRYVRLTTQPTVLFMLGSDNKIIIGSKLQVQ